MRSLEEIQSGKPLPVTPHIVFPANAPAYNAAHVPELIAVAEALAHLPIGGINPDLARRLERAVRAVKHL